jgi:hypothetical protein
MVHQSMSAQLPASDMGFHPVPSAHPGADGDTEMDGDDFGDVPADVLQAAEEAHRLGEAHEATEQGTQALTQQNLQVLQTDDPLRQEVDPVGESLTPTECSAVDPVAYSTLSTWTQQ